MNIFIDEEMVTAAMTDEELVEIIQTNNGKRREAMNLLTKRLFFRTYSRVLRLVSDASVAEDVTQEIFLALLESIDKFRFESSFSTWFSQLVKNKVADYYRKSYKYRAIIPIADVSFDETVVDDDTALEMDDLLSQFSEIHREIIILKIYDGYSNHEIAEKLNIHYEAVRSRYRRAIENAREIYVVSPLRQPNQLLTP